VQNPQASSTVPTRGYLQAPAKSERAREKVRQPARRPEGALKGGEGVCGTLPPFSRASLPLPISSRPCGTLSPRRCTHRSGLGHQLKAALAA
jgi:hypothetical protein